MSDSKFAEPVYVIECAKSGRANCRRCDCKIDGKSVRVGLIIEGDWGLFTRWQHLDCTVFHSSIESVSKLDGFNELSSEHQRLVLERFKTGSSEVDEEQSPINPDELVRKNWDCPADPSDDLLVSLLPFQKEGLGWMLHQEDTSVHGGILADEMGMGKTIQCIALILANRPNKKDRWECDDERESLPTFRGGTLVVLPTVAIRQWQSEIVRFTREGSLSVQVYHGSDRNTTLHDLSSVDIVITSYKILEMEYRKATAGAKITCKLCNKKFYPEKLRVHRKYFCGFNSEKTAAQMKTNKKRPRSDTISSKRSLVVDDDDDDDDDDEKNGVNQNKFRSSESISENVETLPESDSEFSDSGESDSVCKPTSKVRKKCWTEKLSSGKRSKPPKFSRFRQRGGVDDEPDSEVERDIAHALKVSSSKVKVTPASLLHQLTWFRVVLDEAHLIKDRSTSTARAMFNLVSLNKWCLTGTPLQNRVGELYSLIRFLRVDPHAFYYCKSAGCQCKSLHYRFTQGRCDDCSHSAMQHFCHFNKHVLNPIKKWGYVMEGRTAMLKLKQQILDEILLRRTKTTRADDILLPPRVVRVRQERLDEKEEDFYQALYTQSQAQFNTYLVSGTVLNNYAHIFDILIRLRQAVDHPYLVIHSETQSHNLQSAGPSDSPEFECDLCREPLENAVQARCGHWFCSSCIQDYVASVKENATEVDNPAVLCPDCSSLLEVSILTDDSIALPHTVVVAAGHRKKSILNKVDLCAFQSSTKMEALMEELHKMEVEDLGAKAIVFSQFVNMLDLLEFRIQRGGMQCVKLLGSMNIDQRDKSLSAFKSDPSVKVLLISLKAGGMALNLTVASRIFLMDPWWNPAAEMQAIDRTHRIGQHKPIFATRFIVENTIEERILRLQEKKKLVFDGTVGGDSGSMSKLTVDDMRFLFQ